MMSSLQTSSTAFVICAKPVLPPTSLSSSTFTCTSTLLSSSFLPQHSNFVLLPRPSRRCHVSIHASQPPRATVNNEPLVLTEDNVNIVLNDAKIKLGSIFGNSPENRNVGITGDVQLASLDGPVVVLRLTGRFWHKRADVLARVSSYLMERIPEICDTEIEDVQQLDDTLQE